MASREARQEVSAGAESLDDESLCLDPEIYPNYMRDVDVDIDLAPLAFSPSALRSGSHHFKVLVQGERRLLCSECERCHKSKPLGLFGYETPRISRESFAFLSELFSRFTVCQQAFTRRKYAVTFLASLKALYSTLCYDCRGEKAEAPSILPRDFRDPRPLLRLLENVVREAPLEGVQSIVVEEED